MSRDRTKSNSLLRPRVLFLCTGNACRSQMAEGWTRHLLGDRLDACSAGTEPHGLDPSAVTVMREAGVEIGDHASKSIDAVDPSSLRLVVTICGHAHEKCPVFPASEPLVFHRGFDDPPRLAAGMPPDADPLAPYRRVRDEIRSFVESNLMPLVDSLEGAP